MRTTRWLQTVCRTGWEFLFPPECAFCGLSLSAGDDSAGGLRKLCDDCREVLWPADGPSCLRCAAPVGPHLITANGCQHCRKDRFAFEAVVRLGVYEADLKSACLRMKQHNTLPLAVAMAELLCDRVEDDLNRLNAEVVIPVPQHWTRRIWSVHNSAEILARRLARRMSTPYRDDLLWKTRRTARQFSLTPTRRRTNLRRAFAADLPKKFTGKTVLLVDDVLTTGSTAHEASRALRDAGAGRVVVAVIARGIGR